MRGRGFGFGGRGGGSPFAPTRGRSGISPFALTRGGGGRGSFAPRGGRGGSVGLANTNSQEQGQGAQPPPLLCITCKQQGHDFEHCTYPCAFCGDIHNGNRCPRGEAFGRYPPIQRPRYTGDEQRDMLLGLRGVLDGLKAECAELEGEERLIRQIQQQNGIDPENPFADLPPHMRGPLLQDQQPGSRAGGLGGSSIAPPLQPSTATGGSGGGTVAPPAAATGGLTPSVQGDAQRTSLIDLDIPGWREKYNPAGRPKKVVKSYRKDYRKRKLAYVRDNGYSYLLDSHEDEEMLGAGESQAGNADVGQTQLSVGGAMVVAGEGTANEGMDESGGDVEEGAGAAPPLPYEELASWFEPSLILPESDSTQ